MTSTSEQALIWCALTVAAVSLVALWLLARHRRREPMAAPTRRGRSPFEKHTDYVARAQRHQPCDEYRCTHQYAARHCRCGRAWVCPAAGPLNLPRQCDNRPDRYRNEGSW